MEVILRIEACWSSICIIIFFLLVLLGIGPLPVFGSEPSRSPWHDAAGKLLALSVRKPGFPCQCGLGRSSNPCPSQGVVSFHRKSRRQRFDQEAVNIRIKSILG